MPKKAEIVSILEEIGVMLEIQGENPFKTRAYQGAARTLEGLEEDLVILVREKRLEGVKGIGKAIAEKITRLVEDGDLPYYTNLKNSLPPGLLEMLSIPGMGPKKVRLVYDKLGLTTIEELKAACEEHRVAKLPGMGAKSEEKILSGIRNREAYGARHRWWDAHQVAAPILEGLRALPEVKQAEAAGSLRRKMETVGDLDFLVAATEAEPIMDWFTSREGVHEVTAKGETKSSVRLEGGLQADLRVVPPAQYAFALHHFTGSKDHNVAMRSRALQRGYSLSEWGVKAESGEEIPEAAKGIQSEQELFAFLGLSWIAPELREGREEIPYHEENPPPRLIEVSDLRGVFHNHTNASDGQNTLEEMARAAADRGWTYLGLADHSKASFQARGMDEERLAAQLEKVKAYNGREDRALRIFAGVECDILPDGTLDLDEGILAECDYVVAAVHSAFGQDEATMTARIIKALEHPLVTMLAHPTGRLLLRREGNAVNLPKVIDAAIAHNKIIEINAHPMRLDLDWRWWRQAAGRGLRTSINPDAHKTADFAYVEAGVAVARKGWLEPRHVFNTLPLEEMEKALADRRP